MSHHDPAFANRLSTIPPLPFRRGEGRGAGSCSGDWFGSDLLHGLSFGLEIAGANDNEFLEIDILFQCRLDFIGRQP
jgi:hypothetical protein